METNENLICQWLQEDSEEEIDLDNEDCIDVKFDIKDQHVIEGTCESDSEIDGNAKETEWEDAEESQNTPLPADSSAWSSEDDLPISSIQRRGRNYFGKNRFRWYANPFVSRARTMRHNIIQQSSGVKPGFRHVLNRSTTPLDLWKLLVTDDMLQEIVNHTNEKIRKIVPFQHIPSTSDETVRLAARKTCSTCDPKKKRKTFHLCFKCKLPICVECSQKMCITCREKV